MPRGSESAYPITTAGPGLIPIAIGDKKAEYKVRPLDRAKHRKDRPMDKWQCLLCGYIYDPAKGDPTQNIPPGTPFERLPDDWECPDCGASKDDFEKMAD